MANTNKKNTEVTFNVVKKIGVISKSEKNSLELRVVSWNGGDEKYDIRTWWTDKNGVEKCGKGVRLSEEELARLAEILGEL